MWWIRFQPGIFEKPYSFICELFSAWTSLALALLRNVATGFLPKAHQRYWSGSSADGPWRRRSSLVLYASMQQIETTVLDFVLRTSTCSALALGMPTCGYPDIFASENNQRHLLCFYAPSHGMIIAPILDKRGLTEYSCLLSWKHCYNALPDNSCHYKILNRMAIIE